MSTLGGGGGEAAHHVASIIRPTACPPHVYMLTQQEDATGTESRSEVDGLEGVVGVLCLYFVHAGREAAETDAGLSESLG